jgi:predicted ATPase
MGLHVQAEQEVAIPPLCVPDPRQLPEAVALAQYDALALFIQRAQAIKPEFQLSHANARAVTEICRHLDGLPLAIELAAARIKLLPPQALLARLTPRLTLLSSGARDVPERQQTLRNTLAWSYQLLDVEVQRLFRRLSAFVGGCTLQALEAMGAALDGEAGGVFEGVACLLDHSLLQQSESEGEEPRLVMLETIREYAWECLQVLGERETTCQAHAAYYLVLTEQAEPELDGPQQAVWLDRLEREYDNLRAALQWLLEQAGEEEAKQRHELALRLAAGLGQFWEVRGHWSEGRGFLERGLAGSKAVAAPLQVKALQAAAHLAYVGNDTDRAEALLEECLARCRELGDTAGIALSLRLLGLIAWLRCHFVVACSLTEESLALYREMGDKKGTARSLHNLGGLVSQQGEYARAISFQEESLALFREVGDIFGIAWSLLELTDMLFSSQGDPAKVHTLLEEGLALSREVGDKEGMRWALSLFVEVFLQEGNAVKARLLLEEEMALSREIGYRHEIAESLFLFRKSGSFRGGLPSSPCPLRGESGNRERDE